MRPDSRLPLTCQDGLYETVRLVDDVDVAREDALVRPPAIDCQTNGVAKPPGSVASYSGP